MIPKKSHNTLCLKNYKNESSHIEIFPIDFNFIYRY